MKRILDTVHGYIMVNDEFIKYIVDTTCFQRLRRIEQTSIRSVYPSARHDRFIHSLGVFHIGSLIVDHLKKEAKPNNYWGETDCTFMVIYKSYLAACLLHDVAHAPFSHTFESYYGEKEQLSDMLKDEVNNNNFTEDLNSLTGSELPNYHEYMSAYVSHKQYCDGLNRMSLDRELIVRMITGVYYKKDKSSHLLHNCFISLLHGDIIDADRLDYACRDVWASGYSTSAIDLRRLISGIHFVKKEDELLVCFESNCLNEIEGVLNVKEFQTKFVINHHVVQFEQWLLKKAAEKMALTYFPNSDNNGITALKNILNVNSIIKEVPIKGDLTIKNISDDDIIFLLKQQNNNEFYRQWSSRRYDYVALWKSYDEFLSFFEFARHVDSFNTENFETYVKSIINSDLKIPEEKIIVIKTKISKSANFDNLNILIANQVINYSELYPKKKEQQKDKDFYYIFIPKPDISEKWKDIRSKIIKSLTGVISLLCNNSDSSDD